MSKSVDAEVGQGPDVIRRTIRNIQLGLLDSLHVSGAIAIATTKTKVKTAAAMYAVIDGALVTKAITDNAITLSGTVTNAKFNVFVLTMTAAGAVAAHMGTEGATLAAVVWPTIPSNQIVIGYVIVNPTGTGNFVGGTTDLDDATVVPNAVYVNTARPFNPNLLTLPNEIL